MSNAIDAHLTDEVINAAFENTNFGRDDYRTILALTSFAATARGLRPQSLTSGVMPMACNPPCHFWNVATMKRPAPSMKAAKVHSRSGAQIARTATAGLSVRFMTQKTARYASGFAMSKVVQHDN